MRLALVTPWFGRELIGGAERHAWELAHALAAAGTDVDVLATCCRSFNDDWATNYHKSGVTVLARGLRLLRFRVDSRDRVAFNRVTSALTASPDVTLRGDHVPLDERDARIFVGESINSRALHIYLRDARSSYDAILFIPYLYGTTLSILPHVADRAFMIPCLHDEAYAYVEPVRNCFALARGILFNSLGEQETAASIYGPGVYAKSRVVGEAVEPVTPPAYPLRVRNFSPHRSRYVLYLGRQVTTKNIDFLIAAYELFRERRAATSLQLVLAGPTSIARDDDGIVDLGAVSEEQKAALLVHARALAQPSIHESFSRAVYESWFAKRPVIVHGRCRATARAVEDSGGGWIGSTLDDWARMFAELDESSDETIDAVGSRGWAAANDNGDWQLVAQRALSTINDALRTEPGPTIEQTVPLGDRGAALYAAALGSALREIGCDTTTIVSETAPARAGARILAHAAGAAVPAPADLYIAHDAAPDFPPSARVFAVSHDVAARLDERGIQARVLPPAVSPGIWDGARPVHAAWSDGRPVLLSISQLGEDDARRLLDVFVAFLSFAGAARLLVFTSDCDEAARAVLTSERAELDLVSEVTLVGDTLPEQFAAYRAASIALAIGRAINVAKAVMPLWFDVPIVALGDSGDVDAIASAGLIEESYDARRFAALLRLLVNDEALRSAMRIEGRRVRDRHAPRAVALTLVEAFRDTGTAERSDRARR